jgi:glucosamine-6-phosphate deaminase
MRVEPQVFETDADVGRAAAKTVRDRIIAAQGRRFLLGCPGGRSLKTTYASLAAFLGDVDADLSNLVIVMMDDYVAHNEQGEPTRVENHLAYSCERYGRDVIVGMLNAAVSAEHRLADDALWLPDPSAPALYDEQIRDAGGIDLFLLASGTSDGHIAFNPPGSDSASETRLVRLAESTRRDNLATFTAFENNLDEVPTFGVTVGIKTISSLSASVLMVCHGAEKGHTVARLMSADRYDPGWPATIISECDDAQLFIDRAADEVASLSRLSDALPNT